MVTLKEIFKNAYGSGKIILGKIILSEGAWGYGPAQNDTALDLFDKIFQPKEITARLENELLGAGSYQTDEAWGKACLAALALQAFTASEGFGKHLFKKEYAVAGLENAKACLADKQWLASWSDPGAIETSLRNMAAKFEEAAR